MLYGVIERPEIATQSATQQIRRGVRYVCDQTRKSVVFAPPCAG